MPAVRSSAACDEAACWGAMPLVLASCVFLVARFVADVLLTPSWADYIARELVVGSLVGFVKMNYLCWRNVLSVIRLVSGIHPGVWIGLGMLFPSPLRWLRDFVSCVVASLILLHGLMRTAIDIDRGSTLELLLRLISAVSSPLTYAIRLPWFGRVSRRQLWRPVETLNEVTWVAGRRPGHQRASWGRWPRIAANLSRSLLSAGACIAAAKYSWSAYSLSSWSASCLLSCFWPAAPRFSPQASFTVADLIASSLRHERTDDRWHGSDTCTSFTGQPLPCQELELARRFNSEVMPTMRGSSYRDVRKAMTDFGLFGSSWHVGHACPDPSKTTQGDQEDRGWNLFAQHATDNVKLGHCLVSCSEAAHVGASHVRCASRFQSCAKC